MMNSAELDVEVKVVWFDVGHDIEDSGVAVDEGLGVDEADALLLDAQVSADEPSARSSHQRLIGTHLLDTPLLLFKPSPSPRPRANPNTNRAARDPRIIHSLFFGIRTFTCSSGGFSIAMGGVPPNGILPSLAGVQPE